MTRPTPETQTRQRWRQLAEELRTLAEADDFDAAAERVGLLMVREALALGVSTELREADGSFLEVNR